MGQFPQRVAGPVSAFCVWFSANCYFSKVKGNTFNFIKETFSEIKPEKYQRLKKKYQNLLE